MSPVSRGQPEEPVAIPVERFPGGKIEWQFRETTFVLREITVEENDAAIDGAKNPDGNTINNRTMTRLMLMSSIEEPKGFTLAQLVKLPYRAYQHLVDLVNDLNDPDKIDPDPNDSTLPGFDEPK